MKTVENVKIAYIGGGSQGWAWGLMSDLALEPSMSGTVALYDIDRESSQRNETIGNRIKDAPESVSSWKYQACETLQSALTGAHFVIISILPATLDEMTVDVHCPEAFGIYQSVGDTVGPGGIMRALRSAPMYEIIAGAIAQYAPDAWVINYTNPMTFLTGMLYQIFPKIKAFGCCHEVFGTQKILAHCLERYQGCIGVDRRDISIQVLGINHFTWVTKAFYQGENIAPLYAKLADEFKETGIAGIEKSDGLNAKFKSLNKVKFDLFNRYNVIAAAGDRHLAEFCPAWYLKNKSTVDSFGFSLTDVETRKQIAIERHSRAERLYTGEEQFSFSPTGEDGVLQMKALLGLGDFVCNVNLPNAGQISNLPIGAVVETNALFTHNQIIPLLSGALPEPIQALTLRHVQNTTLVREATRTKSLDPAFQAFCNDPLVSLDIRDAKQLFTQLCAGTKPYLSSYSKPHFF